MGYIYEKSATLDQKIIKDIQYITALQPPGGGTNSVDPRFISLFSSFVLINPEE